MDNGSNPVLKRPMQKIRSISQGQTHSLAIQPSIPDTFRQYILPYYRLFLCISTQFRSKFFFIKQHLSADHLQGLNGQLTTSFNLWNGAQRKEAVSHILEIEITIVAVYNGAKNGSHKESK